MPPGVEPLTLFKAIATSPRAWSKFSAASLLDRDSPLALRAREIVIDRTTARCGCDYEWGVHIQMFAGRAGLTDEQVADTAAETIDPAIWSEEDQILIATVDSLLDRKALDDREYAALGSFYSSDQILEIIQLVAFYHGVSLICGALNLQPEQGMPVLPDKGA